MVLRKTTFLVLAVTRSKRTRWIAAAAAVPCTALPGFVEGSDFGPHVDVGHEDQQVGHKGHHLHRLVLGQSDNGMLLEPCKVAYCQIHILSLFFFYKFI